MNRPGFGSGGGGRRSGGGGRGGGNRPGSVPGGYCVCPSCGARIPHARGVQCFSMTCPQCGSPLVKE